MSAPTPKDIGIAGVILTYIGGPHPDCRVHPARLPDDPCAECEVMAGAQVIAKVRQQASLDAHAELERLRAGIEALAEWWQRDPGDGGYEVACEDHARQALALLDPTEGGNR